MGYKAGEYIAKLHPKGSAEVKVAWFPGPPGAGWVEAGNKGFLDAIKDSALEVVATKYGDTGKEVQLKLVEDVLAGQPEHQIHRRHVADHGGRRAASARARSVGQDQGHRLLLHARRLSRTSRRGRIMAAPTDSAVIQGRVAIDQAVRILEGKDYLKHVGPKIYVIDKSNINTFDYASSLAPADFKPIVPVN